VLPILAPIPGASFATQTIASTIFLGIVAAVAFAVTQSLRGKYAEIPALSDAVHMQVR
ncbi:MAG: Tic20 family protein, partial [Chroococcidiopsis sp.]